VGLRLLTGGSSRDIHRDAKSDIILSQDRRRIEFEAFSGNLLGLIATNALELGIDIGVLDAVIMLGFPSSIASFVCQCFIQILFSSPHNPAEATSRKGWSSVA
jgi:hypothetical protein